MWVDALGEILKSLRLETGLISRAELSVPWAVRTGAVPRAMFHAILRGAARLEVEGVDPVPLAAEDLVILPAGDAHVLADREGRTARRIGELPHTSDGTVVRRLVFGGGGAVTEILCGSFELAHGPAHSALVRLLPRILRLSAADAPLVPWLVANLDLLAADLVAAEPGSDAIVTRVTDVLFVRALRAWASRTSEPLHGWLAALRDPQIAEALAILHAHPEVPWTAAELAKKLGMSRTVFHERFRALVGDTPARYLSRWRMGTAGELLVRETDLSTIQVAERVGYASEDAFVKAFRRAYGTSPSAYRRARA